MLNITEKRTRIKPEAKSIFYLLLNTKEALVLEFKAPGNQLSLLQNSPKNKKY